MPEEARLKPKQVVAKLREIEVKGCSLKVHGLENFASVRANPSARDARMEPD